MADSREQKGSYEREETESDRLDRNYNESLQELRVAQTGVQILFAFLLSIAFQPRFEHVTPFQRGVYVTTLILAAASVAQLAAPVAIHRALFGRRRKDELVVLTARLQISGLATMLLTLLGAVLLIVDFVLGIGPAVIVDVGLALIFGYLWVVLPLRSRWHHDSKA